MFILVNQLFPALDAEASRASALLTNHHVVSEVSLVDVDLHIPCAGDEPTHSLGLGPRMNELAHPHHPQSSSMASEFPACL